MNLSRLERLSNTLWCIAPHGPMHVPGLLFRDEGLLRDMDDMMIDAHRVSA